MTSVHTLSPLVRVPRVGLVFAPIGCFLIMLTVRLVAGVPAVDAAGEAARGSLAAFLTIASFLVAQGVHVRISHRLARSVVARERRIDALRRAVLIAARGERNIMRTAGRAWPMIPGGGVRMLGVFGLSVSFLAAFMLALVIDGVVSGNSAQIAANLGSSPLSLSLALAFQSALLVHGPWVWRWIGCTVVHNHLRAALHAIEKTP